MNEVIEIRNADDGLRTSIVSLLEENKLPTEDLPSSLEQFLVAVEDDMVIGVIGLESYGKYGLLRSMVVDQQHRNKNIASRLVTELENKATAAGIDWIYLLTETASKYFGRKGYQQIDRDTVPDPIKASSEFASVCPTSATVMKKHI